MAAIRVRDLHKSYGSVEAVVGIDFQVAEGEVFGFLGPNGAGKTTTVEILEGYRLRSGGDVDVLGHDPARGERAFRQRIGIVLQEAGIDRYLKVAEVLRSEAVVGIDFQVAEGEVFGFLGPNGAGKTTTVEILEGYRLRSGGDVDVLGHDPARGERAFRQRIGIVLQEAGIDRYLKVAEVL